MLQLQGTTSRDFHPVIADTSSVISECGGWVTNHQFYSNIMAMIAFDISPKKIIDLIERLNQLKISIPDLEVFPRPETQEIKVQINIKFMHNKPDIIRTVQSFDV